MTAITQETLSVSGILLAKSFNQQRSRDRPLRRRERQPDRAAGAPADERPVVLRRSCRSSSRSSPPSSTSSPAWLILGGADRSRPARSSPSPPCRRGCCSRCSGCMRVALDLQTSGALFARIFEYLDLKPAITDRPDAPRRSTTAQLGRVEFDDVVVPLPRRRRRRTPDPRRRVVRRSSPGSSPPSSGRPAPARRRSPTSCRGFYEATGGSVRFAGTDVRDLDAQDRSSRTSASSARRPTSSTRRSPRTSATPNRTRPQAELEAAARAANIHETIASLPRRLRHGRRRARLPPLRRREAAHRHRARAAERPGRAHPRRGDQRARHHLGAGRADGPRHGRARPHDHRDRPPPLDRRRRRRHLRHRRRPDRRARNARRAARPDGGSTPTLYEQQAAPAT